MLILLMYLLLGVFAGIVAGLFGVGGGVVIVPVLVYSFTQQGFDIATLTHIAVATSLAIICVTSFSSVWTHNKSGTVLWPVVKVMVPGLVVGVFLGVYGLRFISGGALQGIIGVFLCLVAFKMLLQLPMENQRPLPSAGPMFIFASIIGFTSSLFGIGGGSLSVPLLANFGVKMQKAVATSAACGLPIALAATVANIISGWQQTSISDGMLGFVYLPAFFGIAIMSAPFAKLGALWTKRLDSQRLKRIFSVFLIFMGSALLAKSLGYL